MLVSIFRAQKEEGHTKNKEMSIKNKNQEKNSFF
jgi:hypothetical protein